MCLFILDEHSTTVTRESILLSCTLLSINSSNGTRYKALNALSNKPVKINRLKHIIIQYCFPLTLIREK